MRPDRLPLLEPQTLVDRPVIRVPLRNVRMTRCEMSSDEAERGVVEFHADRNTSFVACHASQTRLE